MQVRRLKIMPQPRADSVFSLEMNAMQVECPGYASGGFARPSPAVFHLLHGCGS
jgi:hypothetical protein